MKMKTIVTVLCLAGVAAAQAETFEEIVEKARALKKPAVVSVPAGTYRIQDTLKLGPGLNGVTFRAEGAVTVSGGREVTGWTRHEGDVWVADVPWVTPKKSFRMLTVDGEPAPGGLYTYATAPEAIRKHLAATSGAIQIGKPGLILLLR